MLSLSKRRGRFQIPLAIIENQPEMVLKVMGEVIVIEATASAWTCLVQYQALSPHFRKVKEGEVIPEYYATVETAGDGNISVKFIEN